MRTMIKLMAVCLSCILLGTASVSASSTTEKSMQAEEILKNRPSGSCKHAYADSHYGYVSYRWKGSGLCIRETVKNGKFQKKEINLRGKAKKYAKKRSTPFTFEWMDAKGNFYFLASEPKKKKKNVKEIKFLNIVNKKGKLTKRINLNDWLKIENHKRDPDNGAYSGSYEAKNYYDLSIQSIEGKEVIASYFDGKNLGFVIFDRNTGKVKRQIVTYEESENDTYYTHFYHRQVHFTVLNDGRLFYQKITTGKKITLPSGNKIRYQKAKKHKLISHLPKSTEIEAKKRIFSSWKNYVYLLAPEGYFRINTMDLSLKKLAYVSELPFWKNEYSDIEFETLIVLSKKKCLFSLYNYTNEPDEHVKLLLWQGKIS